MPATIAPLPPFARLAGFLPAAEHRQLLDWVLSNPAEFQPATVTAGNVGSNYEVSPDHRIALTTKNLGPAGPMLRKRLLDAVGEIVARTGTAVDPQSLDLELSAYGNGAFFAPHIDISSGKDRKPLGAETGQDRIVSAVYHFYRRPKAFSGGALRLHRFGPIRTGAELDPTSHIDLEPLDNSLIAFPSTVIHEVLPIQCPTAKFEDFRFGLNCWFCQAL